MFILVKNHFTLQELADSQLVLKLNDDGKTFTFIKDRCTGQINAEHHNSMLKHFILSVAPKEEEHEETDRVSGRKT